MKGYRSGSDERKGKKWKRSPSDSYERGRKSHSRSRDKERRKRENGSSYRLYPAKVQSDIKNHFKFIFSHLSRHGEEETLSTLKHTLTQNIGPVEHISRTKDSRGQQNVVILVGFRYDIDALSYYQDPGDLTLKTGSHRQHLNPTPTRSFELLIPELSKGISQPTRRKEERGERRRDESERHAPKKSKKKQYSPESSSDSHERRDLMTLFLFGIPVTVKDQQVLNALNSLPYAPYRPYDLQWRHIKHSCCEYLQIRIDVSKGENILKNKYKLQVQGQPILVFEDNGRITDTLMKYQFLMRLPKKVPVYHVLKGIESLGKVVQLVSTQHVQDGKSDGYAITVNDKYLASDMKKLGRLSSGIVVEGLRESHYVYRQKLPQFN